MSLRIVPFRHKFFNTLSQTRFFTLSKTASKSFGKWYRDVMTPKPTNTPPYNHFTQVGDPVLRSQAADVPKDLIQSKEVGLIIEKMINVLHKYDCVGVAAPQIGVSLRIIAMEFAESKRNKFSPAIYEARKMSPLPLTVVLKFIEKLMLKT